MIRTARDLLVVVAAGMAATRVMDVVTARFMRLQPPQDLRQEAAVTPGTAYEVAARRSSDALGIRLSEPQLGRAAMAVHYGVGTAWAPAYLMLRRSARLHPFVAGVATGISLNLAVDEVATTVLGFAAPPQRYPMTTHLRGLVGHLAYGLALAAIAEWVWSGLATADEG